MLKKVLKGILVGAGLLAMTTTAQAADVNLYGASAQFLFWNDLADDLCVSKGCTDLGSATDSSGKHGITECDCDGDGVADLNIRYSSKASYDGIYACKGEIPPSGQPTCETGSTTYTGPKGPRYRAMITSIADPTLSCQEVTIGASDVDGSCFGQVSEGNSLGHLGGSYITRNIPKIDTSSMNAYKSVVVPFGFFKNAVALPDLENLTQPMAGIIFSGTITSWGDFDGDMDASGNCLPSDCDRDDYPSKWVIACLRHAGSGTHATLADLLRCGYNLAEQQVDPVVWFNDGSSDMMRCVSQNANMSTDCFGAIGYADCDQSVEGTDAELIKYQGEECNKCNIKNGVYPFWSAQYLFLCVNSSAENYAAALNMITFGQNNVPSTKADFWNTYAEMRVDKDCGTGITPKATGNWGGACVDSACQ